MQRIRAAAVAIALAAISAPAFSQNAEMQPSPATREDVQELQRELRQNRNEAQRAAERAAKAQEKSASDAEKRSEGLQGVVNGAKDETIDAVRTQGRQQQRGLNTLTELGKNISQAIWIGMLVIVIALVLAAVIIRRAIHAHDKAQDQAVRQTIAVNDNPFEAIKVAGIGVWTDSGRLLNPDIPTLKIVRSRTGRDRIPVTTSAPAKENKPAIPPTDHDAVFLPGQENPVAHFENNSEYVSWKKRTEHAGSLARNATANNTATQSQENGYIN